MRKESPKFGTNHANAKRKRANGVARGIILVLLLAGILLAVAPASMAQGGRVLDLTSSDTHYPVDLYLDFFVDTAGTLTIEDVASPAFADRFVPNAAPAPNFGTTRSALWVRLQVANMDAGSDDWRLAFSDALLSHIDFYAPATDGEGYIYQRGGSTVPPAERPYEHPQYVFLLPLPAGDATTIYLRLQNDYALQFSLTLWPAALFEQQNVTYFLLLGLAYGMLLFILVYHLFVFASVRNAEHFYFLVFLACAILALTTTDGVAYLYLFPGWPSYYTQILVGSGVSIFGLLFVRSFLQLRVRVPWLDLVARFLLICSIALMLTLLIMHTGFVFVYLVGSGAALLALVGGFIVWRQGEHMAGYFLLGWLGLLVLALLRSAAWLGVPLLLQPLDFWSYISDILLFVFLSLALADQINALRRRVAEAERSGQESEARFRGLYEHAPVGIAIGDHNGLLLQANAAYLTLVGYTEQELTGSSQGELLIAEDRARSRLLFEQVLDGTRDFFQNEDRYLRKDGSIVWGLRTVAALRNPDGTIRNTFGIVSDITERKRQEAELRRYSDQMEELVTARTAELEHGREQLVTLNQASQAINAVALENEQLFVAVRAAVAWLMAADFVAISLVDEEAQEVEDVYLAGPHGRQPMRRTPLAGSFVAAMLTRDLTLKVDDFATAPAAWNGHGFGNEPEARSGLAVILRRGRLGVGLLTVQSCEPNAYTANDQSILESFAAHVSIAMENAGLHRQAQRGAVLEERQRLARDLHDSVTQTLYSMALLTHGWGLQARNGVAIDEQASFTQLESMSVDALKEMRLLIHELRPPVLAKVGLVEALRQRLESVEQRAEIKTTLTVEGELPPLSPTAAEAAYYIVQEALNNALRHAQATATDIRIRTDDGAVHLTVRDNGVGFDQALTLPGLGLTTMRERADGAGVLLCVDSQRNEGTTVNLSIALL